MVLQARQLGITDYATYFTRLLGSRPPPALGAPLRIIIIAPASASSLSYTSQVYSEQRSETTTTSITACGSSNFSSISVGSSSNGATSSSSSSGNSKIGSQPLILSRSHDSSTLESYSPSSNSSSLSQSISIGVRREYSQ